MAGDTRSAALMMVLLATVLWSTAGVFVRLVDLDAWTILGWRSVFAALALGLFVFVQKQDTMAPGHVATFAVVPVAVISMAAYVISLKLTTVANVMVVYATVPLVTAGLAYLALREKLSTRAIVASLIALAGVIVMVGGTLTGSDRAGIGVAFAMTAAMATQIVLARKWPGINMAMVNMIAAVLCALLGLTQSHSGMPGFQDMLVLMLFGVTNTALAYYFVLRGARNVPAAEVGLISTLDAVLGPLWVWLLFAETPASLAVAGGAIVLTAVLGYLWSTYRLRA